MDNDDDAIMKDVASAAATAAAAAPPGHNKDDDNDMPSLLAKEGGGADETAAAAVAEDSTAPLAGIDNLQLQDSKSQSKEDDDDEEVIQDSDDDELPPLEGRGGDKAAASGGKDDDDEASTSSTMDEKEESDMKDSIITPNVQQTDDDYLCQATIFKEEGNELFKKGEMDDAARKYRKGMNRLQKIKSPLRQGQEQVQSLKLNLCTNLCMVYSKQNKHRAAVEIATRALKMDSTHVKGLYRRAVAYRQLGDLDSCRDDLKLLLTIDANNKEAKREYALVKRDLAQTREAQKKQLAKAFSRSSSGGNGAGLYDDKEELERRREAESKRKQQEQEEYAKKRKLQWEDECVSRMAKNEPAISFDEWEKEQEEKTKLAEKEKKAEEKRLRAERKKAQAEVKAAAGGDDSDDDSDKLTESELASLRGYKRTKDGRVTSYFTRELSDAERLQIGDIAPKKLDPIASNDDENNNDNASSSPASTSAAPAAASLRSAWNQAGTTWEEKDCTKWCMDQLRTRLQETTITSRFLDADITKVDDLTGEASMAVVQSKKRYIFDFHATCDYEMADLSDGTVVAKGKVRLPDICTTHEHDEYDVLFDAWTQAPPAGSELEEKALETRKVLADGLRTNIKKWLQDFNEQY
jgi:Activator of Hsp90 ATPase, N-terminal/Tetratricopeptide repeat